MTTVNPNKHKCCALCKRWEGDAGLTNYGAGRGLAGFDTLKHGNCMLLKSNKAGDYIARLYL